MESDGLSIFVGDARGRPVRVAGLSSWLRGVAPARTRGRVNIVLVSDRRIRALNRSYRRRDYATDVLSFPGDASASLSKSRSAREAHGNRSSASMAFRTGDLGDVVIARGVARRQARDAGHTELTELRVLALHGLLHLLGYDHEVDGGRMRRQEQRLRRKGGLREGLIERAQAR